MLRSLLILCVLIIWASVPEAQTPRFVYITPVDGTGTETDPFRSRCLGMPGKGNIYLLPIGINGFLCASDELPKDMTGVLQLGDSLTATMQAARKTDLDALARKPLTATRVDRAIEELLAPVLRPGRDGKIKIYLGGRTPIYQQTAGIPFRDHGLVSDLGLGAVQIAGLIEEYTLGAAVAWATTLMMETFTATNGDLHGCQAAGCTHDWDEFSGTNWAIASNQAVATNTTPVNNAVARNTSTLATVNVRASATIVSATTGGGGNNTSCAVLVRKENNATQQFYRTTLIIANAGELNSIALIETTGPSTSVTLDTDTTDWSAGESLYVSADGSSITGGRNNVELLAVTDATITTGTYAGIRYFSDSSSGACTVDGFNARDISSGRRGIIPWFS